MAPVAPFGNTHLTPMLTCVRFAFAADAALQRPVSPGGEDLSAAWAEAAKLGLQGRLEELQRLLALDGSLASATISSTGATALHFAGAKDKSEMARLLLSHGASVSSKTTKGATPLAMACSAVALETASVLVEHGAGGEPSCGAAALHAAVSLSRREVVAALLRGGAATSIADSDEGATPLHIAAITGDAAVAALLLQHGAPTHARYKQSGETALHVAAIKSQAAVAQALIDAGASLEASKLPTLALSLSTTLSLSLAPTLSLPLPLPLTPTRRARSTARRRSTWP